jgi:hypothetical protein
MEKIPSWALTLSIIVAIIVTIIKGSLFLGLGIIVIGIMFGHILANNKAEESTAVVKKESELAVQIVIDLDELERREERKNKSKSTKAQSEDNGDEDDDDDFEDDEEDELSYYTRIAGAKYNTSYADVGGFLGYVRSEPDNKHDPNAIGIYRNDHKLMGHIAKAELEDFRAWSGKENLPCVGYITRGTQVERYGKVKIIDTHKSLSIVEMVRFVAWMVNKFGVDYIPKGLVVNTSKELRTEAQWLEVLYKFVDYHRGL